MYLYAVGEKIAQLNGKPDRIIMSKTVHDGVVEYTLDDGVVLAESSIVDVKTRMDKNKKDM